ncbi:dihydrofolate reductase [Modestobacter sp. DSM 44400]|uniref:dihydrofolate reductase n=1 Tax=Modestobacter sp. DSM 44400 TaxID=1550230 RepID=UPI00089732F1|nr:dihydrofolate reductase [Modestobacter sp. DSM 44400]SDY72786.1 dihydrofolate reductase [Modestobacter sp. DSM 44400]
MSVRLIWAQASGGCLGLAGALPWHLPEDLRLFRALTLGSTVVMGRRTWESLPPRFRPLPSRENVVLSTGLAPPAPGVRVAASPAEVLAASDDFWVIGGASVYAAFLPHADEVVMTEIDARFDGDTWAPVLDASWRRSAREPAAGWSVSSTGLRYATSRWDRAGAAVADPAVPDPAETGRR